MTSNLIRFWKFQLSRITANQDNPEPTAFYPRDTAPLLFRSARSCITDASDSLLRIGPIHSASEEELYQLAETVSGLSHALSLELTIRGNYHLSLVRLESQDDRRALLLSEVTEQ